MEKFKNRKIIFLVVFVLALIVVCILNRDIVIDKTNEMFNSMEIKRSNEVVRANSMDWDITKVDIVEDASEEHVKVPVPKGYVASNADGENIVNTGFVIYEGEEAVTTENAWEESLKRNQWVWIPVPDPSRIYTINSEGKLIEKAYEYTNSETATERTASTRDPALFLSGYDHERHFSQFNLQGMTREKLVNQQKIEFEETIKSIEKYGGFYIGRYETGNLTGKLDGKRPIIRRLGEDLGCNWFNSYSKLGYLGANLDVKTNIIWSSLWDETMQWLIDTGDKTYDEIAKDSSEWGNYLGESFTYITESGEIKEPIGLNAIPTGSTERNKANNIYDLAGNLIEFTLNADGGYARLSRGGSRGDSGKNAPAGFTLGRFSSPPTQTMSVRAFLYIK